MLFNFSYVSVVNEHPKTTTCEKPQTTNSKICLSTLSWNACLQSLEASTDYYFVRVCVRVFLFVCILQLFNPVEIVNVVSSCVVVTFLLLSRIAGTLQSKARIVVFCTNTDVLVSNPSTSSKYVLFPLSLFCLVLVETMQQADLSSCESCCEFRNRIKKPGKPKAFAELDRRVVNISPLSSLSYYIILEL